MPKLSCKKQHWKYNKKHDADCDNIIDIGISVDGTWQKRGFTSRKGAVAAISIETGRILDMEVKTTVRGVSILKNSKKMLIFTNI